MKNINKILIIFVFILIGATIAVAQGYCDTPPESTNMDFDVDVSAFGGDVVDYHLRIYFHVIRRTNGSGGQTLFDVDEAKSILDQDFNPHGIYFEWDGCIDYIDNDQYYSQVSTAIYDVNNHYDGIDIYLYDDAEGGSGRANGVGSSSEFYITGSYWDPPYESLVKSHVISHEMGHVLFLWHTFHGCETGNWEHLDGSDCYTAGDHVCDTPRDPHMNFNVNPEDCEWNGVNHLFCNPPYPLSSYDPDEHIIMGYTHPGCMEYFTEGQGARMRGAIVTLPYLLETIVVGDEIPLSCDCNGDINIFEDIVFDSDRIIGNNIIINPGATVTVSAKLSFGDNKRIVVLRGAKLIVDGGHLTTCEDATQWEGITVVGNSNLPQPNYDEMPESDEAGIVVMQNGAIIENAHIGISTNYPYQWNDQDWGGVVHCENTNFVNCWKGVEFMKYNFENKGYFNHCTFAGWKEGVTIWATDGVTFNQCTFNDKYKGISTIDASFLVQFGNTFNNCDYAIEASASSGYSTFVNIKDDNNFYDNTYAIDFSGISSTIEQNYFEGNTHAIILDGENEYEVSDNSFGLNFYNVISDGTGYNQNWVKCNDMYSQYGGILMEYDNQKTTFLSNEFTGTESDGFDYGAWSADITDEVGDPENISAFNVFSGVERDIDSKEENGNASFDYYIPPNASPELTPVYSGNYEIPDGGEDSENCNTITPPTITNTEITILINDYCYWLRLYREHPNYRYYKWKYHQVEKKFLYKYYWWYKQKYKEKSWKEIEEILKKICNDRWKIKLFGHYMKVGEFIKAEAVLNELDDPDRSETPIVPEDLTDESRTSFISIQRINLTYQQSNGAYQLTESELNTLRNEAIKDIPERAYARGLLQLVTGEKFEREIPELFAGELKQRESKIRIPDKWSIYPNPTRDILFIDYEGEFDGTLVVYSLLGRKMLMKSIVSKRRNSRFELNVSSLNKGVYLVVIRDIDNNLVKSEKIIINSTK